jgi:UPF0271 protein
LTRAIDLNCDLGEAVEPAQRDVEARVLAHVSSVNIACGVHAGDPDLMRRTVQLALAHGVAIGAHPGLRDLDGMGRRERMLTEVEVENLIAYQVGALAGICALAGARLLHVKPHGALYAMAARDRQLADAVARAVVAVDRRLILVGLAGSELIAAGKAAGLLTAEEAFVDRAYQPDGSLVPRGLPGAVIHEEATVLARAVSLARDGTVPSLDGPPVRVRADTLCLHGDTPGADRLARAIRKAFTDAGIRVTRLTEVHA